MSKFYGFSLFGVRVEVAYLKGSARWCSKAINVDRYYCGKMTWFQCWDFHLRVDRR